MSREADWEDLLSPLEVQSVSPGNLGVPRSDPRTLIERAIRRSGWPQFLAAAERRADDLTLVINDPQRPAPTRAVLDVLLRGERGRRPGRTRVLVATGSHTFDPSARRAHEREALGPWRGLVSDVVWHDARAPEDLIRVGRHRYHRLVAEGGSVIAIGGLAPHYFAGCAGAHKTLTIGVMSLADIEANHRGAMNAGSAPLSLDGNPVFKGIADCLAELESAGARLFCVNEILAQGRLAGCTAGSPLSALREGLPIVRRAFERRLASPVHLVVARVEPPFDGTLYQADKGIKNVEAVVADGGVILLEAACREGVGADRFVRFLERARSEEEGLAIIERDGYLLGDHKAVRLLRLTERRAVRVGIVSRFLPEAAARAARCRRFRTRAAGAAWALRSLGLMGRGALRGRGVKGLIVEDAGRMALSLTRGREAWVA